MLTLTVAEARAQFSSVLKQVQTGKKVAISHGRKREPIAVIIPFELLEEEKPKKRVMGRLSHWNIEIADDWKMTTEEFLGWDESEHRGPKMDVK